MEGGEKMEGGREEWCGMMEEGGPKELTHLGSLSPMSAHGCWTTFMSGCLHGHLFSLAGIHLHGCVHFR